MTFLRWVEYPNTMICVNKEDNEFICINYTRNGGNKVSGSEKYCHSIEELEDYLMSIPNPPEKFLKDFILQLRRVGD